MKPYDLDVPACRAHVESCKTGILTGDDAAIVKQHVTGMIQSILGDCPLSGQASQLAVPVIVGIRPRVLPGQRTPVPRNDQFNAALGALLENVDQAFVDIEDYQRRRAANAQIPKPEIRNSVLAFFARKPMEMQWGTDPILDLGLSEDQMLDALHYLEDYGLIEGGGKHVYSGGYWTWQVQLTTHGRDSADGTVQISPQLATIVVQQTFNAPVANAGTVYGGVIQNITFPPMPSDVRGKLMEFPAGEALVEALDEEITRERPRPQKIQKIMAGIKNVMETTNTVSEFLQHFTDWSADVGAWLGDAIGNIADTLA